MARPLAFRLGERDGLFRGVFLVAFFADRGLEALATVFFLLVFDDLRLSLIRDFYPTGSWS